MAEETQPKPSEPEVPASSAEEVAEKPAEETPASTETAAEAPAAEEAEEAAIEAAVAAEGEGVAESVSFKEESNVVADLEDPEKKALDEFKSLIQSAIAKNEFSPPPPPPPAPTAEETPAAPEAAAAVEEPPAAPEAAAAAEEPPAAPEAAAAAEVPPAAPEATAASVEQPPATPEAAAASAEEPPAAPEVTEVKEVVEVKSEAPAAAAEEKAIEETVTETPSVEQEAPAAPAEEVFIWGIPLVGDEKSDTVLLKFLRARDFKVKDALTMLKNAVIWRKQFGIDVLLEEDLEVPELEKVVFYHGLDKEGHPVCYNVYGEFQNKELYAKVFGDEEKREKFLRWRIQYLEKGIREQLDFSPGGVCTMVQVTDLKNLPGPGKRALRLATKKALALLQDNYPEFVAKQVFINVPWWYLAYNRVISPFFTQRSKSKFVFAGPSKSADTLFKYIAPERVPVQYGGLSKESDTDFSTADAVTEVTIKPASKHTVEIPATEGELVWELRVLGWEVTYTAEFVPSTEGGYTVIIQKARKFSSTDEPYVKNSFKIGEPGKVVLTIDNATSKKKKLLYRSKTKTATETA